MNTQPIEKQHLRSDGFLEVHSVFHTIQGEGPYVGRPSVFVRLAGCNLQCPLCDTDYTGKRELLDPSGLMQLVELTKAPTTNLVVITGGEPFRQNLVPFVKSLLSFGYDVQVETNGTLYLEGFPYPLVIIVCSPKAGKVNWRLMRHITAYKYVLRYGMLAPDGLPYLALAHPAAPRVARPHVGFNGIVYVQPVDEEDEALNKRNLEATVESALNHGYTLGIQLHKLIGKE